MRGSFLSSRLGGLSLEFCSWLKFRFLDRSYLNMVVVKELVNSDLELRKQSVVK